MKAQSYWILALLFALLIAIFAVINVEPVEVNYLFGTGEAPLIIIILASVLMGGIVTAAAGSVRVFRLKKEVRHLKNSNKADKAADEESNDHSGDNKDHAGDRRIFPDSHN